MFINVNVGSMGTRKTIIADTATATPNSLFAEAGIDISSGQPSLNGMTLRVSEMGQTLDELRVDHDSNLSCIVKADSAR